MRARIHSSHAVQVRLADSRERMGCSYVISVLGAIRVTHIGIVLKDNNKVASAKQPSVQFSTLSELVRASDWWRDEQGCVPFSTCLCPCRHVHAHSLPLSQAPNRSTTPSTRAWTERFCGAPLCQMQRSCLWRM
jgi:hypothetical protein